jgi:SAM-dependent methyltransferase
VICRACDSTDLTSVLDLGKQPLANRFLTEEETDQPEPTYPLHLVRCLTCGLCQLDTVVDPDILYNHDYPYRSGYSDGWKMHCASLAAEVVGPGTKVLDIGCLDGVFLESCRWLGGEILGIDPSAPEPNDYSVPELFDATFHWRHKFDVIVAQNVFGHVDDAKDFLEGVAENLAPNGQAIIEVPWVVPMICEGRWDTIYHEHVSYWGLHPLRVVANAAGLALTDSRLFPDIHGGTIRCYLHHGPTQPPIAGTLTADDYQRFAIRAYGDMKRWDKYFQNIGGRSVAAYGASAKLNTFLNALPDRPPIVGVFDDNPTKWNLYTPGWHFPVLKPTAVTIRETEVLLVGASNWKAEIETKAQALGFTGEIVSLW